MTREQVDRLIKARQHLMIPLPIKEQIVYQLGTIEGATWDIAQTARGKQIVSAAEIIYKLIQEEPLHDRDETPDLGD